MGNAIRVAEGQGSARWIGPIVMIGEGRSIAGGGAFLNGLAFSMCIIKIE